MTRRKIHIERTFDASLEDVWDLWTTKEGIESWWGPEGFSVTVRRIDLWPGGELLYDMTATGPDQIEFLQRAGMPRTTEARVTYREVVPGKRLSYVHRVDFAPGVAPYDVEHVIELFASTEGVRMVLTIEAMHDEDWTSRAVQGWESELGKLGRVLAARVRP
jgi:uncharacterized protein YndB with AHSA1/START domain